MRINPWLVWILLISLLILGLQSLPTDKPVRAPAQASSRDASVPTESPDLHSPTASNATEIEAAHTDLKVYRWQDDSGEWHVSNEPPPETSEYQVHEYTR